MEKPQTSSGRQKAITGIVVIIAIVVIWQVIGLFRKSTPPAPLPTTPVKPMGKNPAPAASASATQAHATLTPHATPSTSTSAPPASTSTPTPYENKAQQEMEEKYAAAVNELQMLKITKEIVEANKAIMDAKLATIKTQTGIIEAVKAGTGGGTEPAPQSQAPLPPTPIQPPIYQPAPQQPGLNAPTSAISSIIGASQMNYTVVSVLRSQRKWSAVLSSQGKLYYVSIGDVLSDDSVVSSIDRTGVTLQLKSGMMKRLSLTSMN